VANQGAKGDNMKPVSLLVMLALLTSPLWITPSSVTAQSAEQYTISFQNGVSPTASYAGGRDTYLSENNPNGNYNNDSFLRMDGNDPPGTYKDLNTLLYWDISAIPAGARIVGVTLEFRVSNPSGGYVAFELLRDWSETEATWNQASAGQPWQVPGGNGEQDRVGHYDFLADLAFRNTTSTFSFYPIGIATVQKWVNDPATNHGLIVLNSNQSDGAAVYSNRYATAAYRPKLTVVYELGSPPPVNQPPVVNAGPDQTLPAGTTEFQLTGTLTDDGLPTDPGLFLVAQWSVVENTSGGPVTFSNPEEPMTNVTVTGPGIFRFQLRGSDGELASTDEVTVTIPDSEPPEPNAQPLVVSMYYRAEIRLPETNTFIAEVEDDGLPDPPGALTYQWTKLSGPGEVTFSNPTGLTTQVSFSQMGDYSFRFQAFDGELWSPWYPLNVKVYGDTTNARTITFQQGLYPTTSYAGMRDAYIREQYPTSRYGSSSGNWADANEPYQTGYTISSLLYWDLSSIVGLQGEIVEAGFTLYVTNPTKQNFFLYPLKKGFVESEVTWRNASATVPWSVPGVYGGSWDQENDDRYATVLGWITAPTLGSNTILLNNEGIEWLRRVQAGTQANYGFLLAGISDDGLKFYSRNASTARYRPALFIRYIPSE
jgi:hypothetical protein